MKILTQFTLAFKKRFSIISLVFVLLISWAHAQPPVTQEWLQRYDFGGTSDKAVGLVLDSTNNVYVTISISFATSSDFKNLTKESNNGIVYQTALS
jgi:alpha/beta superfamily hydrolase